MTMQEIKDRIDELIQSYPFIENSEVLLKKNFNTYIKINTIEVDRYCRPVIIIDDKL